MWDVSCGPVSQPEAYLLASRESNCLGSQHKLVEGLSVIFDHADKPAAKTRRQLHTSFEANRVALWENTHSLSPYRGQKLDCSGDRSAPR